MKFNLTTLAALALLSTAAPPVVAAPTHQFDQFFPGWDSMLQELLRENCSAPYAPYRTGNVDFNAGSSSLVTPVIECILSQFPEFRKAELTASAVILGLLPSILMGLGSTAAETSYWGSEFTETVARFVEGAETIHLVLPRWSLGAVPPAWRPVISVLEYLVAGGAVANVVMLAYQLGVHAIVVFAPETVFLLPLWTFFAVLIHLAGVLSLHLRVRVVRVQGGHKKYVERRGTGFGEWVPEEVVPSAFQSPKKLQWREGENALFEMITWLLGVGTVTHMVLGTLVLSSMLFFSVVDSVTIVARYMVSSIACRAVLRFELSGMREGTKYQGAEGRQEEEEVELTQGSRVNSVEMRSWLFYSPEVHKLASTLVGGTWVVNKNGFPEVVLPGLGLGLGGFIPSGYEIQDNIPEQSWLKQSEDCECACCGFMRYWSKSSR
ncbi:uncharacterized protein BCR38DRAFT_504115 [Pseudomassariella vexata]|uniref:Uncharacterized protein n=1 Tax=Pseudomassariella vexata TaxID=1141098 RepID=A0A1Y2EFZ8_9PEZI|nr:uncharacterized protein BCR38DRAFT_504115 [Pseudomassariella vexata]ORY70502.1 hypothetical protein BCR38DRAFT_504115 [Pseudomassariella vexata]